MLITTSENIPGKNIVSTIGYVKGSSARARHAVADIFAGLKNIVGGEVGKVFKTSSTNSRSGCRKNGCRCRKKGS